MTIPSNILQSMISLNANQISYESIILQSYKDMRKFARNASTPQVTAAEKFSKLVDKTREKISLLTRNQVELKKALRENQWNGDISRLTEVVYD